LQVGEIEGFAVAHHDVGKLASFEAAELFVQPHQPQHLVGHPIAAGGSLQHADRCDQRGYQPRARLEHQFQRFVIEEDAVLDRAGPGACACIVQQHGGPPGREPAR
jgi:hypothetical protein